MRCETTVLALLCLTACHSDSSSKAGSTTTAPAHPSAVHSADPVVAERLQTDVAWLADDAREGRRAGTDQGRAAGQWIADPELAASHRIFVQLWKTIGDSTLLMELIKRDMNILRARTGTRIAASASSAPALVYRPTTGETEGPNFYRDIRHRLEARLNYIATSVEVSDIATQSELNEIKSLEDQVRQELAALELP
jgi:hypothetical protein